tara:strand:+ start:48 stop:656 length:609 start_codon:yes stop_codon:yes gene_type:complete
MSVVSANNNALSAISALPSSISGGALTLISTQTASSSASLDFTSGIDSTYKEYVFQIISVHPATANQRLTVNFRDGSTAFDATKTTTSFRAFHPEDDGETPAVGYITSTDLAQGTGDQPLFIGAVGNDNDSSGCGNLHLFDPSNTTFVKHFIFRGSSHQESAMACDSFVAGYCNVTAAIDGVQFKFASGNIDSGVIKMYGIS